MGSGVKTEERETAQNRSRVRRHHNGGLLMIGGFKLLEAAFFFLVGIGAFHFLHRDLSDAAYQLAARLRMDPDGRVGSWVFDHLDALTSHRLRQIGFATIFYAALRIVEGVGLVMEKLWAEYLTVGVTISFLPWEVFEVFRKPDWLRFGLLIINLLVVAYLLWWLRRSPRVAEERREAEESRES